MATSDLYKFDVGETHSCNGFPVRPLLRQREEGAGHWLVAHRKAVEEEYRDMYVKKYNCIDSKPKESVNQCVTEGVTTSDTPTGNTLDAPFLIRLHCVDEPSELCAIDISEQELTSVKSEDLKAFDNVAYINASVNSLSLECFGSFCSLRELTLCLNGLRNMTFNADDFPYLQVLDLSYNNVSADDIAAIGQLPCLKVLHLSGNHLRHLPPGMGSSYHDHAHTWSITGLSKANDAYFRALEVLMLDDNRLSSGVFSSLANLKRLQHLNLQGNNITEIPYLQPRDSLKLPQTFGQKQESHIESNQDKFKRLSEINSRGPSQQSDLPLPELQFLNLAENKIAKEEAVMAAAFFPMLNEIILHSNPLTIHRSGDPPLLTHFLQERLGITIKRKKTPKAIKRSVITYTDLNRKVNKKLPRLQKKLLLKEAPLGSLETSNNEDLSSHPRHFCYSQTKDRDREKTNTRMPQRSEARDDVNESYQNIKPFFFTQATGLPDYELNLPSEENKYTEELEMDNLDAIPEKFLKDYKMLTDAKPNPDVVQRIGIQPTVRMLEQTLKNLIVHRDYKTNLNFFQRRYGPVERRIVKLPPLKSKKSQSEKVEQMLKDIRENQTFREIPLTDWKLLEGLRIGANFWCDTQREWNGLSILNGNGVYKQDNEEAWQLLEDMKKTYKMVRMKTVEEAAHIESEINSNKK